MKLLFTVLFFLTLLGDAVAQGGPWKWEPFPSKHIDYPQQNSADHRQYQWFNEYIGFVYLQWDWTSEAYPDHENLSIRLANYTGEALEVTVSIQEMDIERDLILPPYSDEEYHLARMPDGDEFQALLYSGVHLFMQVSQVNYHFRLGGLFWGPGAWNAPGGSFLEHNKNYGHSRPNK